MVVEPASSQGRSAAQLMAEEVVLKAVEVAQILRREHLRGELVGQPDPSQVFAMVRAGVLRPVDPSEPARRWRFATSGIARYLAERDGTQPLDAQVAS